MKKAMKALTSGLLAAALLAGCGAPASGPAAQSGAAPASAASAAEGGIESFTDLAGKQVAVNSIPLSAEEFGAFYKNVQGIEFGGVKVTPTVMESTMMVQNGQVDGAITPVAATAEYFCRQNDGLKTVTSDIATEISIALDAKNTELLEQLNGALSALKEDGTIDALVETWIDNATADSLQGELTAKTEGAQTLTIGISGDVMPLDYVAADGTPAGFNVALMTEIGKKIDRNIEFVVVPTDAKFASILSGKIDAFFWHVSILPLPETIAATDSYYSTHIAAMVKK